MRSGLILSPETQPELYFGQFEWTPPLSRIKYSEHFFINWLFNNVVLYLHPQKNKGYSCYLPVN